MDKQYKKFLLGVKDLVDKALAEEKKPTPKEMSDRWKKELIEVLQKDEHLIARMEMSPRRDGPLSMTYPGVSIRATEFQVTLTLINIK